MPKLPVVQAKDLIRTIKKIGFYEHRQRGTCHLIMAHSDGRRASVPVHPGKDIPKGTLKAILNDLQISTGELIKLLKD